MKARLAIVVGTLCVATLGGRAPRAAWAQDAGTCSPACQAGESCVGNTCMVPACRPPCGAGETCVGGTCMVPAAPPPVGVAPPPAAPVPPPPVAQVAPPAPEAPEPPPVSRHGAFLIPQVGTSAFLEDEAVYLSPGLRVGALAGGYVTNAVSLGGGLTFDLMNWDVPNSNSSGYMLEAAFAPLLHLGDQRAEFIVGPALGAWMRSIDATEKTFGDRLEGNSQGWALGGNVGLFVPVRATKVRLGAIVNFMLRETVYGCATLEVKGGVASNTTSHCGSGGPAYQVLGVTFAAML